MKNMSAGLFYLLLLTLFTVGVEGCVAPDGIKAGGPCNFKGVCGVGLTCVDNVCEPVENNEIEAGEGFVEIELPAGEEAAGEEAAGELVAGEVTAGEVAAGEVAAGEVAAGEVAAGELAAGEVAAGEVAAGEVAAGR